MNTPSGPETPSFEDSLRELEETVSQLEAGELPLEESLALFEKGVGSLKRCHAILDKAEKRVQILVKGANGASELRDTALGAGTPARPLSPVPARKKSTRAGIDAERPARQNAQPCPEPAQGSAPEPESGRAAPQSPSDEGTEPGGPGGSLFGVAQ